MQIYGIDLAKEKFDVSFLRLSSKSNVVTPVHHVVRNTENGIKAFLKGLPSDSVLVAEHTGVYGERLLKMCTEMSYNKFLNKINGDLNIYAQNSA